MAAEPDAAVVTNIGATSSAAYDCNVSNAHWGTVPPGGACQAEMDCAPTCCACQTGTKSAMVTWCNAGTCASAAEICCGLEVLTSTSSDTICH